MIQATNIHELLNYCTATTEFNRLRYSDEISDQCLSIFNNRYGSGPASEEIDCLLEVLPLMRDMYRLLESFTTFHIRSGNTRDAVRALESFRFQLRCSQVTLSRLIAQTEVIDTGDATAVAAAKEVTRATVHGFSDHLRSILSTHRRRLAELETAAVLDNNKSTIPHTF